MRISAGKLKGRSFEDTHSGKAHPMSERIRNALFNSLGDISGLSVLDAFGGSGALAFEAISRGARDAVVCELDKKSISAIESSIKQLGLTTEVALIKRNVYSFIEETNKTFDLVIVDPPFADFSAQKFEKFFGAVKPKGVLVLSMPSNQITLADSGAVLLKRADYGNASLVFYRNLAQ